MQIHRHIGSLPVFRNAVVTTGTFDGVHTGHWQIISQLKEEARRTNGETVIITFHPHPRQIIPGQNPIQLLNSQPEKIRLLEQKGIDHLVIVPFTTDFSEQSAEDYITRFLVKSINPRCIIIGYDHRFGKDRKGDYRMLEAYGAKLGFVVKEIPEKVLNEVAVSSTRIRKALLSGNIDTANELLGYEYNFEGMVVKGNQLGRAIGYPTANLEITDRNKLVPGDGIYAVLVEINGTLYKGMMSIGVRPTIDNSGHRTIEVNIFDFDEDIYGATLRVHLKYYLRPELKFNDLNELTAQLAEDKINTLKKLIP
ncbi:MAG: bifunctional riboflavin kinase/FAD synthetase [Chitinophagaceae bacterium]|nr:bifunctional riboflavin kinase/FAD synthetase [Chitinophagaceae bacterium]MCW5928306.1 bifunctional riboflavin kinase/FAD synthetase [Chitinophagaceae bacterium]